MFFEDIEIIYDWSIFEYSQLFENLRLEHEMHDAHFWRDRLRKLMNTSGILQFSRIPRYE